MNEHDAVTNATKLLLTVNELGAALGLSTRSVWRLSATGDLPPPLKIGGSARWRKCTVDAWLAQEERAALRRQKADTPGTSI